ncbi:MAG: hypothetical protein VXX78_03495 [Pseudomonadota bacterium]|nr:hypothetical protein [Pseudomonadota bacterium]
MTSHTSYPDNRWFLMLFFFPILLSLVVAVIYEKNMEQNLSIIENKYSNLAAAQIYKRIEKHVIAEDIVSLNLLVTQLIEEKGITFIEVTLGSEKMIEVGKKTGTDSIFSYEVIFNGNQEGLVTIRLKGFERLSESLAGQIFLILSVYAIVMWFFSSSMVSWLNSKSTNSSDKQKKPGFIQEEKTACILVIRIKPAHYMERYFQSFYQAAQTYQGRVEQTMKEEIIISFTGNRSTYDAARTGLLIKSVISKLDKSISFGGAISAVDEEDLEGRKSTSYLALIAADRLLLDNSAQPDIENLVLQPFRHALFDSESIYSILNVEDDPSLEKISSKLVLGD